MTLTQDQTEAMNDAGMFGTEITRPDPRKVDQVMRGFKWLCGEWRQVTDADVEAWRNEVVLSAKIRAEKLLLLDAAFSSGREYPGVSHVLGSDWGPGGRTNGRPEGYKSAAYETLNYTYGRATRELARIERQLARTLAHV